MTPPDPKIAGDESSARGAEEGRLGASPTPRDESRPRPAIGRGRARHLVVAAGPQAEQRRRQRSWATPRPAMGRRARVAAIQRSGCADAVRSAGFASKCPNLYAGRFSAAVRRLSGVAPTQHEGEKGFRSAAKAHNYAQTYRPGHDKPSSSSNASSTRATRIGCHVGDRNQIPSSAAVTTTCGSLPRLSRLESPGRSGPMLVGSAASRWIMASALISGSCPGRKSYRSCRKLTGTRADFAGKCRRHGRVPDGCGDRQLAIRSPGCLWPPSGSPVFFHHSVIDRHGR
jgi:hypothetical protein